MIKATNKVNFIHKCLKWIILLILISLITFTLIKFETVKGIFMEFIDWLTRNPIVGAFYYIIIVVFASIVLFPNVLLLIGSGYAFT